MLAVAAPPEDEQGEGRCHRQRHHERGESGEDVGQAEGPEQGALQPAHEQDRQEDQRDDKGRVDHAAADLERGGEHYLPQRSGLGQGAIEPQPTADVLHVDDRVVHHFTQGDRQSAQRERVDAVAQRGEDHDGGEQREWNGRERDGRRTQVGQEEHQHDGHEGGAQQQGVGQVADGQVDELGGPEEIGMEGQPRGLDCRTEVAQRRLRPRLDVTGIGAELGRDHDDAAAFPIDGAVAERCLGAGRHPGNVAQAEDHSISLRDYAGTDLLRRGH